MRDEDMSIENQIAATPEQERQLDEAIGLRKISLRLPRQKVMDVEAWATAHGMPISAVWRYLILRTQLPADSAELHAFLKNEYEVNPGIEVVDN